MSEPSPSLSLSALLSNEADDRLDAIASLDATATACFAVRELLLSDENAHVRAAAAEFLHRADARTRPQIIPALCDALYDTHPSVRLATCRTLSRLLAKDALYILRRLALEEPIWWVRRGAVLAVARIAKEDAIDTLRAVLDDPFWRVRHAAVRALLIVSNGTIVEQDVAGSERAQAALQYLAKKFGVDLRGDALPTAQSPDATTASPDAGALGDPDPAVIAARLEHGQKATAAELALYVGDPHEALRNAAADRLIDLVRREPTKNVNALAAASLWLEEPRIPHATARVVTLLDALGNDAEELLDIAQRDEASRPGLMTWAISFIATNEAWDRLDTILTGASSAHASVRRVAISALGAFAGGAEGQHHRDSARFVDVLVKALDDTDEDTHRLAVHALVQSQMPAALRAVLGLPFAKEPAIVRRLIAVAAGMTDAIALLHEASDDVDPETRAHALFQLHARSLLDGEALAKAQRDDDPWVRGAVLSEATAVRALESDVDPALKRAAFDIARALPAASRVAMTDSDAWLRTVAAEQLARSHDDEDLVRVLRLSRDPDLAVRAAAANVLDTRDLEERLLRVRDAAPADDVVVHNAADTWLGIRAPQLIAEAEAYARLHPASSSSPQSKQKKERAVLPVANARPLGTRSGLVVSPLAVSGVNEPSIPALFRAMNAGCNLFFWEPRYRNLTTFLKAARERGQEPLVVGGTYHATERAIRNDVELALRRLRRDHLDVMLVFWVRSPSRLEGEVPRALERLKREGLVRAVGFSTHDRELAENTLARDPWDVIMIRHSAAHPGAEERLFAKAHDAGVGVLGFSATSYTRLMRLGPREQAPSAVECYRYSLSQHGLSACVSAPRGGRELVENLAILEEPTLPPARIEEMRAHGKIIRAESKDFNQYIRRFPTLPNHLSEDIENDLAADLDSDIGFVTDNGIHS